MIPVQSNDYYEGIEGERAECVQFNFKDKGFSVSFMKYVPKKEMQFKTDKITLDWGLKVMFATADGGLFGRKFYSILLKYDKIISELAANRQRQGFKTRSKHYDTVVSDLQEYIKNEINRVINRIVDLYKPKLIVDEDLNFQNPDLSKRMNRILQNCGRKVIGEKLESLKEVYGITIDHINPAYTSQECSNPSCHYVAKNNRTSQANFKCKYCGRTLNADVNAARVQDYRSSIPELANVHKHRKTILRLIVNNFLERHPRRNSTANDLLRANPYFKDVLAQPKLTA
jgi:putative transposase